MSGLVAVVLLSAAAAVCLTGWLPDPSVADRLLHQNVFLACLALGLSVWVVGIRWVPSLGRAGKVATLLTGAACAAAAFFFGLRGLAALLVGSALVDAALYITRGSWSR